VGILTKGRRGFEKILEGSVAEKVVRRTSIPLLVIPTKTFPLESRINSSARNEIIYDIQLN
jgi:hypothetical protein